MKPIEFAERNIVYGGDQPEYKPLPAFNGPNGHIMSCWRIEWRERFKLLFTGRLWVSVLAFNKAPQPLHLTADYPFIPSQEGELE